MAANTDAGKNPATGRDRAPIKTNARTSRDQDQRENDDDQRGRKPLLAERPGNLPKVPTRPGFVQRYVRTRLGREDDIDNVARKEGEGWRPRKADTLPTGVVAPTIKSGEYQGYIGVRGNILMERPIALNAEYKARNRQAADHQMAYVENQLHAEHRPGAKGLGKPKMKLESEVGVRRRGKPVQVQEDDEED